MNRFPGSAMGSLVYTPCKSHVQYLWSDRVLTEPHYGPYFNGKKEALGQLQAVTLKPDENAFIFFP